MLPPDLLPPGFVYPREYLRVLEFGLTDLEPWYLLTGDQLRQRHEGLKERCPTRDLIPFAARQDRDDLACWHAPTPRIALIHDWASPGWEFRGELSDFATWLHAAIDDFLAFD